MSGKSTLLRTVGLNAVLAQMGAPVRATRLQLTPLAVGTCLRTADSLQLGRSGFYAEILRLRQILQLTEAALPLLFLFDELLDGTNSHDRVVGGEGLLRALLARPAVGLISTHDLALTGVAAEMKGVRNVHFEDQIEGNDVRFDHHLRPGVVTRSNALALMRIVGLDV
jgi:DNA mismatch repair ATPase MutS